MSDRRTLLRQTADLAADFLEGLPSRPVHATATHADLLNTFGGPLPDRGEAPGEVVSDLATMADPGLIASAGPRYFGFVIGGSLPSALAADWLTSAWDNNAGLYAIGPSASVAEEVAATWLVELFGLPAGSSVGFSTGATMASFTALAAGRHRVLERAGWNVEEDGLQGAPEHGGRRRRRGPRDDPRLAPDARALAGTGSTGSRPTSGAGCVRTASARSSRGCADRPVLVSAQSGNVNTGAFDPLPEIVAAVRELPNAWLHVDGAFGLWAAVAPSLRA